MDRTGKIAVALALAVLIAWMIFSYQDNAKRAVANAAKAQAAKAEAAANPVPADPATTPATPATTPPVPVEVKVEEKQEKVQTPLVDYTFSNLGGGIATASLKKFYSEGTHPMVLNEFGTTPIGAVSEAAGMGTREAYEMKVEGDSVQFERLDARQIQWNKRFTVLKTGQRSDEYIVTLDLVLSNRGTQPVTLPTYYIHTGAAAPVHPTDQPTYTGFMEQGGGFTNVTYFEKGWFSAAKENFRVSRSGIAWAGVADQYFTTVVTPQVKDAVGRGTSAWATRFQIQDTAWAATGRSSKGNSKPHYGIDGALGMPAVTLEPGKSVSCSFRIFAGPRQYELLELMPEDQAKIMNFGWFRYISQGLLWSLNKLHLIFGSFGLAIVALTLIIKSALWPMQNKATQSMKRMQLLQPKMTELREKYKDDPARMNTEVMKLYKDYGVNPFSGCLPMLIQIPIFFGFFNMLGTAVELRGQRFLWVPDLSLPDELFRLPLIDFPVNLLPLIMAVTMFWQMSLSPKSGDPMQQRIFMFMPIIFIMFCYNYASALALYWTVQNLFSVVQLYATRKQEPPTLQKVK